MKENSFVHFLGAAGTVTGSKYLLDFPKKKILIDCGLFQGLKELRQLNWNFLPVEAPTIDIVLLTHGHLDHIGYLPILIKAGYKGKIYGSSPTLEIAEIILKDSAKIQEEEADRANRSGYSKHHPAKPLYNLKDVEQVLTRFENISVDEWIDFGDDVTVRFQSNGHILGSTFIEINFDGKLIVFSGDVGQDGDLLLYPPKKPVEADVLFIESTYGDRLHTDEDISQHLKRIILETVNKGGTLIIPSFAVGRSQTLMYLIWQLKLSGAIPNIPLILDSPMGANVLQVYHKNENWYKIPYQAFVDMCEAFDEVQDFKETMAIIATPYPKIVIAGSGMVTGGRVLSYLQHYIEKHETTLLFVGYQGEGTRGRRLLEGEQEIKIYGKYYKVKAHIETINGLSAHGDQKDMINWMSELKKAPEKIFVIHGEQHASETLCEKIKEVYGWDAIVPNLFEIKEI